MPEPVHSSLKAPRNSRITSTRPAFHSSIPLSSVRSSLFPLVSQCQPQPATPRNPSHSLAPAGLNQPDPRPLTFLGSRISLLVQLRTAQSSLERHYGRCGLKLTPQNEFFRHRRTWGDVRPLSTFAYSGAAAFAIVGLRSKQSANVGLSIPI
jgi:hypothetical protein